MSRDLCPSAKMDRRIMDFSEEEFNFVFGTACAFYKGKWPKELTRRIGSFRNHPLSECPKNHWWVANSDKELVFCPYCGLNISWFHSVEYDEADYTHEALRSEAIAFPDICPGEKMTVHTIRGSGTR